MNACVRAETLLGLPVQSARWNASLMIRPEQAKALVEAQPQQRPVSSAHVEGLQLEMKAGRFVLTNEALAFDENGLLFDGQHRLWACFVSGLTMPALCCFNEPRSNFDHIGTLVRRRTSADHLMISGVVSEPSLGNTVAGAARFLWSYEDGLNPVQSSIRAGWSADIMRDVIGRHPGLLALAVHLKTRRKIPLPLMPLVALATLMEEADAQKSAVFMHQLTSGEGLSSGNPALTLRESALARLASKRGYRTDMTYRIVRAWNAHFEGRSVHRLYGSNAAGSNANLARKGGLDPFPQVAGYNLRRKVNPSTAKSRGKLIQAGFSVMQVGAA